LSDGRVPAWRIVEDDATGPEITALIAYHVRSAHATTPPQHAFALGIEALRAPEITLWTLWENDALLGCAALKDLGAGEGELKSMRTAPDHLRRGVGAHLLDHAIGAARARGWQRLNLETGKGPSFAPAWELYRRFGFTDCGPYADYAESDHNRFMTLSLVTEKQR
jgi:putative acetyltransferase